jgi:hypothetical protein
MTEFFDKTVAAITPQPINVYGLKFFPNLEPNVDNDQDTPAFGWPSGPEISLCNQAVVVNALHRLGDTCKAILEIGVNRNGPESLSKILMDSKPKDCTYIGIDLNDKSFLNSLENKIHTIQANSHDQLNIRNKISKLGIEKIDLIMIDGWHSVNTCVNDWCYVDMLSDNGIVLLHDTNAHPGCCALFHAVDENLFEKQRHCTYNTDMGIATFWHKKS